METTHHIKRNQGQWWTDPHKLNISQASSLQERTSLVAQLVKNPLAIQEILGLIPGSGRSAREGIGYPLQYSWAYLVAQLVKNLPAMQEI